MAEQELLSAIKEDNLARFSADWNERTKTISFGRFPVLSLCYLYDSRRILTRYEKELLSVDRYTFAEEDTDSYRKFRPYAGKALRLYVGSGKTVTPPEMLAVLGENDRLKWLYPKFYKNEKIRATIEYIERTLYGNQVTYANNAIRIRSKKMKKGQLITACTAACLSVLFCVLSVFLMLGCFSTEKKQTDVFNEQRLILLLKDGKDCSLSKDIVVTEEFSLDAYGGTLDGNGHTLSLPSMNHAFFGTLSEKGIVKNLTVSVTDGKYEDIDEDWALFVQENVGKLENVHFQIDATVSVLHREAEKDEEGNVTSLPEDVYISCVVGKNKGTISGCSAEVNINGIGTTGRDSFLTVFASKNSGLITDCSVSDTSTLLCDTLDLSGFVTVNGDGTKYCNGTVQDSIFAGTLSQTTSSNSWSPNVGGFLMYNYGVIIGCEFSGTAVAENTYAKQSEEEELLLEIHVAGIAVYNHYTVQQCLCSGTVEGKSGSTDMVVGGLVSMNMRTNVYDGKEIDIYLVGSILFSDSIGNVKVSSSAGGVGYAGGIVGYNYGTVDFLYSYISAITYCISTATVEGGEGSYLGGLVGLNNFGSVKMCFADATINGGENSVCGQTAGLVDFSSVQYAVQYGRVTNYYSNSAVTSEKIPYAIGQVSKLEVGEYNNVQTTYFESRAAMFNESNPAYKQYLTNLEQVKNANK